MPNLKTISVDGTSYDIEAANGVISGGTAGQVLAKKTNTDLDLEWVNQSGGGGASPYTSNPADLGMASPGVSDNYSRGDHVHNKPTYTASDVGAVAVAQGVGHAGEFLVVGNDGNVTTVTLSVWQGGSF